jgi:protein-tyrosine-phosphatase
MAVGILRNILEEKGIEGEWRVESAGTWGLDGEPAAVGSLAVMENKGIDISDHRARRVDQDLLESFDLILTMERGQKESMRMEFPRSADRIFLLSEMVGRMRDIDDPYGGVFVEYEDAAEEIETHILNGLATIIHHAAQSHQER